MDWGYDIANKIKQKRFIGELFRSERYFDCITETQRLLNYHKDIPELNEYQYLINTCYYMGGQYKTVVSKLENSDFNKQDKTGLANIILLSHSYLNLHYDKLSMQTLDLINYNEILPSVRNILLKNRIILLLRDYNYKEILSEIDNAEQELQKIEKKLLKKPKIF